MGAKVKTSDVMDMIGLSLPQPHDEVLFNPQVVPPEPAGTTDPNGPGAPGLEPSTDKDLHGHLSHALAHADDPQPSNDADLPAIVALGSVGLGEPMASSTDEELRREFGPLLDAAVGA